MRMQNTDIEFVVFDAKDVITTSSLWTTGAYINSVYQTFMAEKDTPEMTGKIYFDKHGKFIDNMYYNISDAIVTNGSSKNGYSYYRIDVYSSSMPSRDTDPTNADLGDVVKEDMSSIISWLQSNSMQ